MNIIKNRKRKALDEMPVFQTNQGNFDMPYMPFSQQIGAEYQQQPQQPQNRFEAMGMPMPPQLTKYSTEMQVPETNTVKANAMKRFTRDQAIGQLASSLFKGLTFAGGMNVAAERPQGGVLALQQLLQMDQTQDQNLREAFQRMLRNQDMNVNVDNQGEMASYQGQVQGYMQGRQQDFERERDNVRFTREGQLLDKKLGFEKESQEIDMGFKAKENAAERANRLAVEKVRQQELTERAALRNQERSSNTGLSVEQLNQLDDWRIGKMEELEQKAPYDEYEVIRGVVPDGMRSQDEEQWYQNLMQGKILHWQDRLDWQRAQREMNQGGARTQSSTQGQSPQSGGFNTQEAAAILRSIGSSILSQPNSQPSPDQLEDLEIIFTEDLMANGVEPTPERLKEVIDAYLKELSKSKKDSKGVGMNIQERKPGLMGIRG
jgi:hypothetical protein